MDFNADLNRFLRYGADEHTVVSLLRQMQEDPSLAEPDHHHRLIAADALQDNGRDAEANLLRSPHRIYQWRGKVFRKNGDDRAEEQFIDGYHEAAVWASTDEEGVPLDGGEYGNHETDPETQQEMDADARHFFHSHHHLMQGNRPASHAGHDFWLNRNGHGTGFWDRDDGDYADADGNDTRHLLNDAARQAGEYHLDADPPEQEDGKIFGFGGTSKHWGQKEGLVE